MTEEKLEKLISSVKQIELKVDNITQKQKEFDKKLASLEDYDEEGGFGPDPGATFGAFGQLGPHGQTGPSLQVKFDRGMQQQFAHNPTGEFSQSAVVDALREFDSIKESLQRIKLPSHLKVADSQTGIRRECKDTYKVIAKCSRFAETGLRWIGKVTQIQPDQEADTYHVPEEMMKQLYNIFFAQIGYLRGEYTNLVVQSTFDSDTAKYFKSFESNQTTFTPQSLQNVRVAAELSSIANRRNSSRGRGGYFRGSTSRGRGSSFHRQQPDDMFTPFVNRTIPSRRPGNSQDSHTSDT